MSVQQAETAGARDGVRIDNARWKLMRSGADGFVYSWQVDLVSERRGPCEVTLETKYLDEDGFEIDSQSSVSLLSPGATLALTGRSFDLDCAASQVRIVVEAVDDL